MHYQIKDKKFEPFLSQAQIAEAVDRLAARINADYEGKNPLCIGVLNGSFVFVADLFRRLTGPAEVTFVKVASYEAMESKGAVEEILGLDKDLMHRHVIILEDIIDTGITITDLVKTVKEFHPASVEVAALLLKPDALKRPVNIKYVGFEIPTRFVVGYGLDYDGLGRNLPAIYQLTPSEDL